MQRKRIRMIAVLAGLVLLLGACGNNTGKAEIEQDSTQTESDGDASSDKGEVEETTTETTDQDENSSGRLTDITLSDLQGEWFEIKSVRKLAI